jgi:osmotically inducible protein OsmC
MGIKKASAEWNGTLKAGKGTMKPGHGAEVTFSFGSRFEDQADSNPEEMIGAALAGCFSMALSSNLEKAGATPKRIRTSANVKLEKETEGFTITAIELTTEVEASGIDAEKFQSVADTTKKTCPVSRALGSVRSVTVNARLSS